MPHPEIPDNGGSPFFSVVIPTRNRPSLCREAILSVTRQAFDDVEIIVVNDGSSAEFRRDYDRIANEFGEAIRWFRQPERLNGHGPSYSINSGAALAGGKYLCVLDDDDIWTDPEHLRRVHRVITALDEPVDAYYSNQRAYFPDGETVPLYLWLSPLTRLLPGTDQADAPLAYRVEPEFLLRCRSFPHLNCTIVRRALFLELGGMDEGIRYECEVDLYLRFLDRSKCIVFDPHYIARHNVPFAAGRPSESTGIPARDKYLSQIRLYQKSLAGAERVCIRAACRSRLALMYKKLGLEMRRQGRSDAAACFSRVAPAFDFSCKWWAYGLYLNLQARFLGALRKSATFPPTPLHIPPSTNPR